MPISDPGTSSLPAPAVLRPRAVGRPTFTAVLYSPQAEARAILSGYGAMSCTVDTTGDGGGFEMDLPPTVDRSLLKDGSFVVVYKRPPGGVARYKETYVILNQSEQQARRGTRWPKIEGPSLTSYLLGKDYRIINALENETGASVTATAADNAIRYFINGAMGAGAGNSGTSLGRDLSQIIGLTVETNRTVGPLVTHNGYLQPLDSVIRAIAKKAEEDTTAPMRIRWQVRPRTFNPLTFDVVLHTAPLKATTRVVTRKRGGFGVYRGFDAPAPVILGPAFGTVVEADMERDRTGEHTSVVITYNSKAARTRTTDSARALDFPLAFREVMFESTTATIDAEAQTDAAGKLKEGEAREVMRVKLLDSAATRYDADYFLGDVIGVLALDRRWEAEIVGEENTVDRGGVNTSLKLKEED